MNKIYGIDVTCFYKNQETRKINGSRGTKFNLERAIKFEVEIIKDISARDLIDHIHYLEIALDPHSSAYENIIIKE